MQLKCRFDSKTLAPIALLTVWGLFLIYISWNNWAPDLSALFFASYFYGIGDFDLVYGAPEGFFGPKAPLIWRSAMHGFDLPLEVSLPYVYPPIWAALFSGITPHVHPVTFSNAIYIVHVSLLMLCFPLAWRLATPNRMRLIYWLLLNIIVAMLTYFVFFALFHNQVQITVIFLSLLALERLKSGRSTAAGFCLGLAATIKISPLLFAILFVMERDWRALGVFTVTGAVVTAASFAIAGPTLHWEFLARVKEISSYAVAMNPNFGTDGFLYQLYMIVSGIEWERGQFGFNTWDEPFWVSVFMKMVAAASIFFIIVASRNLSRDDRILTFTIGLTLAINLSGPLGWVHYYLPIIIFAPALPLLLGRRLGWAIVGAISLAFSRPINRYLQSIETEYYLPMMLGVAFFWVLFVMVLAKALQRSRTEVRNSVPLWTVRVRPAQSRGEQAAPIAAE